MWTLVIVSQNDGTTFVLLVFDWTCSCLQQDAWQGNTMHIPGTTTPITPVVFEIKSTSKLVYPGIRMSFFDPQMKQKQPNSWSMWKIVSALHPKSALPSGFRGWNFLIPSKIKHASIRTFLAVSNGVFQKAGFSFQFFFLSFVSKTGQHLCPETTLKGEIWRYAVFFEWFVFAN